MVCACSASCPRLICKGWFCSISHSSVNHTKIARPRPHADMALMVKCRSPPIRSCPCSIFSGVSVPLARKRDTSPEIISDLDGRSLFKVHILTTCFVASIRAVASPHRCTAKSAPVPIGGGVEMCLNLRPIFGGPAQTEDDLSGSVPFGGNQVWLCRRR